MALYLDIHRNQHDATEEEVVKAHLSDLEAQETFGVKYIKYWFDQETGTICCLIDAPNKEACAAVHQKAHGNLADDIIEVEAEMIAAFLGGMPTNEIGCALNKDGKCDTPFRTILFTDIVNSTAHNQSYGDEKMLAFINELNDMVKENLAAHSGREVKNTGDGIMGAFVAASDAVRCALAINSSLADKQAAGFPLAIRTGLNAGEPIAEHRDLFGAAVQLAARVCDKADANQILVASVVKDLCAGKSFQFSKIDTVTLKGFDEPTEIYEVK